jgi:hypothetical protein
MQFNTNLADLAKVARDRLYNVPHSAKSTLKAIRTGTIGEKLTFSFMLHESFHLPVAIV